MFHIHDWVETGRTWAPPREIGRFRYSGDPDLISGQIDKARFGITSIELRCAACGDIKERVLLGNHTKES